MGLERIAVSGRKNLPTEDMAAPAPTRVTFLPAVVDASEDPQLHERAQLVSQSRVLESEVGRLALVRILVLDGSHSSPAAPLPPKGARRSEGPNGESVPVQVGITHLGGYSSLAIW